MAILTQLGFQNTADQNTEWQDHFIYAFTYEIGERFFNIPNCFYIYDMLLTAWLCFFVVKSEETKIKDHLIIIVEDDLDSFTLNTTDQDPGRPNQFTYEFIGNGIGVKKFQHSQQFLLPRYDINSLVKSM